MATFKEIRGQTIKKYTTDPTNPLTGQMWYNSTTGTLKGRVSSGAWSSSTPLTTATAAGATLGTQTAALITSGYGFPTNPSGIPQTEVYNGTSWTEGGDMGTARGYVNASGGQSGTIGASGGSPVQLLSEEYSIPNATKTFTAS